MEPDPEIKSYVLKGSPVKVEEMPLLIPGPLSVFIAHTLIGWQKQQKSAHVDSRHAALTSLKHLIAELLLQLDSKSLAISSAYFFRIESALTRLESNVGVEQ